ncbi:MAG: formylglycine-generating enzyme family protein [Desulfobacteraceae bacterium]|nr:formylglycine-generating enzyme family protein [Desulfobacteraceae bacterium]
MENPLSVRIPEEARAFFRRLTGKDAEPVFRKRLENSLGMEFVYIPPGSFEMGSPEDELERYDDEMLHRVTLTRGFYMQTTQVTQGQWKAIMGDNPSRFKEGGDTCPVEQVSWDDVQEFIRKLNLKEGKTYRLPTEAEWEYSCRAGTETPFYTGKCLSTDQANYDGDYPYADCPKGIYRKKTMPVASFDPNPWGLYDMHGNVWEWCQDWYGDYPADAVTDPGGPSDGSYRVLRGGSWIGIAGRCRSGCRSRNSPGERDDSDGFRLVLLLPRSAK